jgi:hypothetical protein
MKPFAGPAFIGTVHINPDNIRPDGEYVVAFPINSKVLSVGMYEGHAVLWVLAPALADMQRRRLWVVPGGQGITAEVVHCDFVGTVFIIDPQSGDAQDWHVFYDATDLPSRSFPVQATYTLQ